MSESNRNPDEIEEKLIDLPEGWTDADFENEPEPIEAELPPETPVETPETPAETPETPAAPASRVPPLLAEVEDPTERRKLIEDAIQSLPPEERVNLKGVDEIVRGAHQLGQQAGETNYATRTQQQQQQAQLDEAAETFVDRARQYGSSPDFKWEDELANVERYAADQRQSTFVNAMSRGLGQVFKEYGISSLPQELQQRVNAVDPSDPSNFAEVIYHYASFLVASGAEAGKRLQGESYAAQQEADAIAMRARSRNEALAEMGKNGRIRISRDAEGLFAELVNTDPPALTGNNPTGAVVVDEAEWELAMRDPEAYDRMMADPGKRAYIDSLTAQVVGGRR